MSGADFDDDAENLLGETSRLDARILAMSFRTGYRIKRSNDMLRTRASLAQERQSQSVLESLNRSAQRQLQLQQAVETVAPGEWPTANVDICRSHEGGNPEMHDRLDSRLRPPELPVGRVNDD